MPPCNNECYRIETKYTSYAIDEIFNGPNKACKKLSAKEAEEHVAQDVKNHNDNHSIEEIKCGAGCICVPYETPQKPVPLKPRNIHKHLIWSEDGCVYGVNYTVAIQETKIPIGICRPS